MSGITSTFFSPPGCWPLCWAPWGGIRRHNTALWQIFDLTVRIVDSCLVIVGVLHRVWHVVDTPCPWWRSCPLQGADKDVVAVGLVTAETLLPFLKFYRMIGCWARKTGAHRERIMYALSCVPKWGQSVKCMYIWDYICMTRFCWIGCFCLAAAALATVALAVGSDCFN